MAFSYNLIHPLIVYPVHIHTEYYIYIDEFAVQTCFLGRYGEEIGSDQFGAVIMANQETNSTNQQVVIRLSNVEVKYI